MRAIPGWMCYIDFSCELGKASGGNKIYPSEQNLRENHKYVDECGVAEVVTMSKDDFLELVEKSGIDITTIHTSNFGPVIWSKDTGLVM